MGVWFLKENCDSELELGFGPTMIVTKVKCFCLLFCLV